MKSKVRGSMRDDTLAKCVHGAAFGEKCQRCEDCIHGVWHGAKFCPICAPEVKP